MTTYEKVPYPRESGAWITSTEFAFEILTKFINIDELHAITSNSNSYKEYRWKHWKTQETFANELSITNTDPRYTVSKAHRVAIHKVLLKHTPENSIKYGHKLESLRFDNFNDTVLLKFDVIEKDLEFELVITADGIYSGIRTQLYPEIAVKSRGAIAYRNIFPEDLVEHIDDYAQEDGTLVYTRGAQLVFLSKLGLGTYGIVLIISEPDDVINRLKWDNIINADDHERLKKHFTEWPSI